MKNLAKEDDRFLWLLKQIIHLSLKALGLLMILVIIFGVIDVAWTIYQRFMAQPRFILTIGDILMTLTRSISLLPVLSWWQPVSPIILSTNCLINPLIHLMSKRKSSRIYRLPDYLEISAVFSACGRETYG